MNHGAYDRVFRAILLIAFFVRIGAGIALRDPEREFGDTSDYVKAAQNICDGTPYPRATELPFFRAPGLPIFLAFSSICSLNSLEFLNLLLILIDMIGLIGFYHICKQLHLELRATHIACALLAFSPFTIGQSLGVQTEALFQATIIWCFYFYLQNKFPASIALGALFGFAALIKPQTLGLIPVIIFAIKRREKNNWVGSSVKFCCALILVIAPWSVANWQRTGQINLINDAFTYNLWRGNTPLMTKIYAAQDASELADLSILLEHHETANKIALARQLSQPTDEFFLEQAYLEFIQDPPRVLNLTLRKAWVFIRPWLDSASWNKSIVIVTGIWETCLYLLSLYSLCLLIKKNRIGAMLIILYFATTLLIHLPFQVVARFRIPYWEAALCLLAVARIRWKRETN